MALRNKGTGLQTAGFSIPKIKKNDILQKVSLTSRDAQDLLKQVDYSFLDDKYKQRWKLMSLEFVHSPEVEKLYRAKRQELKEEGRSLQEQLCFLSLNQKFLATKIAREGLRVRFQSHNALGNSNQGLYLWKYIDSQLRAVDKGDAFILVFKVTPGRCKPVTPSTSSHIEPTPNFDCHVSSIQPRPSDSLGDQFRRSQIYLYEYTDEAEPSKQPRQCLPYALLQYYLENIPDKHEISAYGVSKPSQITPHGASALGSVPGGRDTWEMCRPLPSVKPQKSGVDLLGPILVKEPARPQVPPPTPNEGDKGSFPVEKQAVVTSGPQMQYQRDLLKQQSCGNGNKRSGKAHVASGDFVPEDQSDDELDELMHRIIRHPNISSVRDPRLRRPSLDAPAKDIPLEPETVPDDEGVHRFSITSAGISSSVMETMKKTVDRLLGQDITQTQEAAFDGERKKQDDPFNSWGLTWREEDQWKSESIENQAGVDCHTQRGPSKGKGQSHSFTREDGHLPFESHLLDKPPDPAENVLSASDLAALAGPDTTHPSKDGRTMRLNQSNSCGSVVTDRSDRRESDRRTSTDDEGDFIVIDEYKCSDTEESDCQTSVFGLSPEILCKSREHLVSPPSTRNSQTALQHEDIVQSGGCSAANEKPLRSVLKKCSFPDAVVDKVKKKLSLTDYKMMKQKMMNQPKGENDLVTGEVQKDRRPQCGSVVGSAAADALVDNSCMSSGVQSSQPLQTSTSSSSAFALLESFTNVAQRTIGARNSSCVDSLSASSSSAMVVDSGASTQNTALISQSGSRACGLSKAEGNKASPKSVYEKLSNRLQNASRDPRIRSALTALCDNVNSCDRTVSIEDNTEVSKQLSSDNGNKSTCLSSAKYALKSPVLDRIAKLCNPTKISDLKGSHHLFFGQLHDTESSVEETEKVFPEVNSKMLEGKETSQLQNKNLSKSGVSDTEKTVHDKRDQAAVSVQHAPTEMDETSDHVADAQEVISEETRGLDDVSNVENTGEIVEKRILSDKGEQDQNLSETSMLTEMKESHITEAADLCKSPDTSKSIGASGFGMAETEGAGWPFGSSCGDLKTENEISVVKFERMTDSVTRKRGQMTSDQITTAERKSELASDTEQRDASNKEHATEEDLAFLVRIAKGLRPGRSNRGTSPEVSANSLTKPKSAPSSKERNPILSSLTVPATSSGMLAENDTASSQKGDVAKPKPSNSKGKRSADTSPEPEIPMAEEEFEAMVRLAKGLRPGRRIQVGGLGKNPTDAPLPVLERRGKSRSMANKAKKTSVDQSGKRSNFACEAVGSSDSDVQHQEKNKKGGRKKRKRGQKKQLAKMAAQSKNDVESSPVVEEMPTTADVAAVTPCTSSSDVAKDQSTLGSEASKDGGGVASDADSTAQALPLSVLGIRHWMEALLMPTLNPQVLLVDLWKAYITGADFDNCSICQKVIDLAAVGDSCDSDVPPSPECEEAPPEEGMAIDSDSISKGDGAATSVQKEDGSLSLVSPSPEIGKFLVPSRARGVESDESRTLLPGSPLTGSSQSKLSEEMSLLAKEQEDASDTEVPESTSSADLNRISKGIATQDAQREKNASLSEEHRNALTARVDSKTTSLVGKEVLPVSELVSDVLQHDACTSVVSDGQDGQHASNLTVSSEALDKGRVTPDFDGTECSVGLFGSLGDAPDDSILSLGFWKHPDDVKSCFQSEQAEKDKRSPGENVSDVVIKRKFSAVDTDDVLGHKRPKFPQSLSDQSTPFEGNPDIMEWGQPNSQFQQGFSQHSRGSTRQFWQQQEDDMAALTGNNEMNVERIPCTPEKNHVDIEDIQDKDCRRRREAFYSNHQTATHSLLPEFRTTQSEYVVPGLSQTSQLNYDSFGNSSDKQDHDYRKGRDMICNNASIPSATLPYASMVNPPKAHLASATEQATGINPPAIQSLSAASYSATDTPPENQLGGPSLAQPLSAMSYSATVSSPHPLAASSVLNTAPAEPLSVRSPSTITCATSAFRSESRSQSMSKTLKVSPSASVSASSVTPQLPIFVEQTLEHETCLTGHRASLTKASLVETSLDIQKSQTELTQVTEQSQEENDDVGRLFGFVNNTPIFKGTIPGLDLITERSDDAEGAAYPTQERESSAKSVCEEVASTDIADKWSACAQNFLDCYQRLIHGKEASPSENPRQQGLSSNPEIVEALKKKHGLENETETFAGQTQQTTETCDRLPDADQDTLNSKTDASSMVDVHSTTLTADEETHDTVTESEMNTSKLNPTEEIHMNASVDLDVSGTHTFSVAVSGKKSVFLNCKSQNVETQAARLKSNDSGNFGSREASPENDERPSPPAVASPACPIPSWLSSRKQDKCVSQNNSSLLSNRNLLSVITQQSHNQQGSGQAASEKTDHDYSVFYRRFVLQTSQPTNLDDEAVGVNSLARNSNQTSLNVSSQPSSVIVSGASTEAAENPGKKNAYDWFTDMLDGKPDGPEGKKQVVEHAQTDFTQNLETIEKTETDAGDGARQSVPSTMALAPGVSAGQSQQAHFTPSLVPRPSLFKGSSHQQRALLPTPYRFLQQYHQRLEPVQSPSFVHGSLPMSLPQRFPAHGEMPLQQPAVAIPFLENLQRLCPMSALGNPITVPVGIVSPMMQHLPHSGLPFGGSLPTSVHHSLSEAVPSHSSVASTKGSSWSGEPEPSVTQEISKDTSVNDVPSKSDKRDLLFWFSDLFGRKKDAPEDEKEPETKKARLEKELPKKTRLPRENDSDKKKMAASSGRTYTCITAKSKSTLTKDRKALEKKAAKISFKVGGSSKPKRKLERSSVSWDSESEYSDTEGERKQTRSQNKSSLKRHHAEKDKSVVTNVTNAQANKSKSIASYEKDVHVRKSKSASPHANNRHDSRSKCSKETEDTVNCGTSEWNLVKQSNENLLIDQREEENEELDEFAHALLEADLGEGSTELKGKMENIATVVMKSVSISQGSKFSPKTSQRGKESNVLSHGDSEDCITMLQGHDAQKEILIGDNLKKLPEENGEGEIAEIARKDRNTNLAEKSLEFLAFARETILKEMETLQFSGRSDNEDFFQKPEESISELCRSVSPQEENIEVSCVQLESSILCIQEDKRSESLVQRQPEVNGVQPSSEVNPFSAPEELVIPLSGETDESKECAGMPMSPMESDSDKHMVVAKAPSESFSNTATDKTSSDSFSNTPVTEEEMSALKNLFLKTPILLTTFKTDSSPGCSNPLLSSTRASSDVPTSSPASNDEGVRDEKQRPMSGANKSDTNKEQETHQRRCNSGGQAWSDYLTSGATSKVEVEGPEWQDNHQQLQWQEQQPNPVQSQQQLQQPKLAQLGQQTPKPLQSQQQQPKPVQSQEQPKPVQSQEQPRSVQSQKQQQPKAVHQQQQSPPKPIPTQQQPPQQQSKAVEAQQKPRQQQQSKSIRWNQESQQQSGQQPNGSKSTPRSDDSFTLRDFLTDKFNVTHPESFASVLPYRLNMEMRKLSRRQRRRLHGQILANLEETSGNAEPVETQVSSTPGVILLEHFDVDKIHIELGLVQECLNLLEAIQISRSQQEALAAEGNMWNTDSINMPGGQRRSGERMPLQGNQEGMQIIQQTYLAQSVYPKVKDSLLSVLADFNTAMRDHQLGNVGRGHQRLPADVLLPEEEGKVCSREGICLIQLSAMSPNTHAKLVQLRKDVEAGRKRLRGFACSNNTLGLKQEKERLRNIHDLRASMMCSFCGRVNKQRLNRLDMAWNRYLACDVHLKRVLGEESAAKMTFFVAYFRAIKTHHEIVRQEMVPPPSERGRR